MLLSDELGFKKEIEKIKIEEDWGDPVYCLAAVKQNGLTLRFVQNQTPEICLAAVKNCTMALKYVQNQTPEICLTAVTKNGLALQYVQNQTEEICLAAIKKNGLALKYVQNQTPEICLAAVKQYSCALEYVKEQTEEICLAAIKKNENALKYVKNQTLEMIYTAVNQNIDTVNYINTDALPIKDWNVEWFQYVWNIELRRQFIKERGREILDQLNCIVIDENKEYCLVKFKYIENQENFQKALVFRCPSSSDIYFQEIDPTLNKVSDAVKFLNNNINKEELAFES